MNTPYRTPYINPYGDRPMMVGDQVDMGEATPVNKEEFSQPDDPHSMDWGGLLKMAGSSAGGGDTGTVQSGGIGKYRSALMSLF